MDIHDKEILTEFESSDPGVDRVRYSIMGKVITGEAGRPVVRGSSAEGRAVPGADLSPQQRIKLQAALNEIRVAELAVQGNDVITVVLPQNR